MRFKLSAILFSFIFLSINLVSAYYPSLITPENAAQMSQISSIESSYLGEIVWSHDSDWLAVGTSHDGVQVFNANNLILPPIQVGGGLDVLFHPNNQLLASAGTVWNIPYQQASFSYGPVDYKLFSPDGNYLITAIRGTEQTDFTVYAVPGGNILHSFTVESLVNFPYLVFSEDSSRFALLFENTNRGLESASFIQLRESATGSLLAQFDLQLPQIKFLTFSNGGQYLAAFNYEETYAPSPTKVIIWEIETQTVVREFGLEDWYPVLSPNGKWHYVADNDYPYIINLDTGRATTLNTYGEDTTNSIDKPVFSADGQYMALRYTGGFIVWRLDEVIEGWLNPVINLSPEQTQIDENPSQFAFSHDNQRIALGYQSQTIVWNLETSTIEQTIPASGAIRFIPDTDSIVIGSSFWDGETLLNRPVDFPTNFYFPLISPDGRLTVTHSPDSIKLLNIVTGEETLLPILDDYLGKVEYLNTENNLAIFRDTALHAFDLSNQQELRVLNPGPREFITSDDGSILVAFYASQINLAQYAVSIYHLRDDNENPITLNIVLDAFNFDAAISPDNQYLLISQGDAQDLPNRTALYSIETGEMLASWSAEVSVIRPRVLFSPDSQYVLTMANELSSEGYGLNIKIWELSALLAGETEARSTMQVTDSFVEDYELSFNSQDNYLVMMVDYAEMGDAPTRHNYRLFFFDWDSVLEHTGEIIPSELNPVGLFGAHSPAFNPNTSLLLTRGNTPSQYGGHEHLYLWDMATGEIVQDLPDYIAGTFNPDATLLAGLSQIGEVVLWDTVALSEENPSPIFSLDIPDAQALAFSSDGTLLYVRTTYSLIILGVDE